MTPPGFSNDWKKSFQWLEKSAKFFPMIGKHAKIFSNGWKTCGGFA
jgi:hypothetical protein